MTFVSFVISASGSNFRTYSSRTPASLEFPSQIAIVIGFIKFSLSKIFLFCIRQLYHISEFTFTPPNFLTFLLLNMTFLQNMTFSHSKFKIPVHFLSHFHRKRTSIPFDKKEKISCYEYLLLISVKLY